MVTTLLSILKKQDLSKIGSILVIHIWFTLKKISQQVVLAVIETLVQPAPKVSWELNISNHSLWRPMSSHWSKSVQATFTTSSNGRWSQSNAIWRVVFNSIRDHHYIFKTILWSYETMFKLNGHINRHNSIPILNYRKPTYRHSRRTKCIRNNMWLGIGVYGLISPCFFEGNVWLVVICRWKYRKN